MMDRIFIRDLEVRCILGISPDERREKQDIRINIDLFADLRPAAQTDRFDDAVDYRAIKKRVVAMVEQSAFYLVETLAERIAGTCLESKGVQRVRVSVEKPTALRFARSVGVEIERER